MIYPFFPFSSFFEAEKEEVRGEGGSLHEHRKRRAFFEPFISERKSLPLLLLLRGPIVKYPYPSECSSAEK